MPDSFVQRVSLGRQGVNAVGSEIEQRGPRSALVNTETFGFILIHSGQSTVIPLYFLPQEIQDSYQPNWNDQVVPGRSEPIRSYAHGGPRRVSCNLVFVAQGGSIEVPVTPKEEVHDVVTLIRSALFPEYSSLVEPPPQVTLSVGKFLQIKGILSQAEVRWMGPWDVQGGMYPMRAELAVTVEQVNPRALGRTSFLARPSGRPS